MVRHIIAVTCQTATMHCRLSVVDSISHFWQLAKFWQQKIGCSGGLVVNGRLLMGTSQTNIPVEACQPYTKIERICFINI